MRSQPRGTDRPTAPRQPKRRRRRLHVRALGIGLLGVIAIIAGLGFGTPGLRTVGLGLVALGLGAILMVELVARGVRVTRSVDRDILHAGEPLALTMRLSGPAVGTGLLHLLDWNLLSGLPRGTVERRGRTSRTPGGLTQSMTAAALPRGSHRLGLPAVALGDAFGLVRVRRATRAQQSVLVLPRVVPVRAPFWEGRGARRPGDTAGAIRGRFELDGVRDYEPGDPLSLIHWGQTARRGTLQTKELHGEAGHFGGIVLVLDTMRGADAADVEVAVSAAASLAEACVARGSPVGLQHRGRPPVDVPPDLDAAVVVRTLATVEADGDEPISQAVRAASRDSDGSHLVVAVAAQPDRALGPTITQLAGTGTAVAVVLVGAACADAGDLRARRINVAEVTEMAGLEDALNSQGGARARRH